MIKVYAVCESKVSAEIRARKLAARFGGELGVDHSEQGWIVWSMATPINNMRPLWTIDG